MTTDSNTSSSTAASSNSSSKDTKATFLTTPTTVPANTSDEPGSQVRTQQTPEDKISGTYGSPEVGIDNKNKNIQDLKFYPDNPTHFSHKARFTAYVFFILLLLLLLLSWTYTNISLYIYISTVRGPPNFMILAKRLPKCHSDVLSATTMTRTCVLNILKHIKNANKNG